MFDKSIFIRIFVAPKVSREWMRDTAKLRPTLLWERIRRIGHQAGTAKAGVSRWKK